MAITITTAATGTTIFGSHGIERNQGVIWLQKMSLASFRLSWTPSRTGSLDVARDAQELFPGAHTDGYSFESQRTEPNQQDQGHEH